MIICEVYIVSSLAALRADLEARLYFYLDDIIEVLRVFGLRIQWSRCPCGSTTPNLFWNLHTHGISLSLVLNPERSIST